MITHNKKDLEKQLQFLESENPKCVCWGQDCYDCYLTGYFEGKIRNVKRQMTAIEDEGCSGGYGDGEF